MTTAELRIREADFRERRRRVLRGMGAVAVAGGGGIALVAVVRALAPEAFDAGVAVFVASFAASGLAYWLTLRRHWRCPVCEARWDGNDALASAHWNHCPACGTALRAVPVQAAHERIALTEFALEDLSEDELAARFLRRRRRGLLASGAAVVAGAAILVWSSDRGWSEMAEQAVAALFVGVAVAVGVTSARCPRCRVGLIAGRGRHCQRCGLRLRSDLGSGAESRTGS